MLLSAAALSLSLSTAIAQDDVPVAEETTAVQAEVAESPANPPVYELTRPRDGWLTGTQIFTGAWTVGSAALAGWSFVVMQRNNGADDGGNLFAWAGGVLGVTFGLASASLGSLFWLWKGHHHARLLNASPGIQVQRWPSAAMLASGGAMGVLLIASANSKSAHTSNVLFGMGMGAGALMPVFGTLQFVKNLKGSRAHRATNLALAPTFYDDGGGLVFALTF